MNQSRKVKHRLSVLRLKYISIFFIINSTKLKVMSRTNKDMKSHKKWDKRVTEHKAGVMKQFKRASNKKMRRTPIRNTILDMNYTTKFVSIKVPKNIVPGYTPLEHFVEVLITVCEPKFIEVENFPTKLDKWIID